MRRVWLTHGQAAALVAHARADAPHEACGLLVGDEDGRVTAVMAVANSAAQPEHAYRLDDAAFAAALMQAARQGQALVGFYHSHPQGDAIPSSVDVRQATYPDAAYVIVGLAGGGEAQIAAWQMRYGDVVRLRLHIGDDAPADDDPPLSRAGQIAIVISAALAFAALLLLSLSLLPPAPAIPLR